MTQPKNPYSFEGFVLDTARGTLTRNGAEVPLRPKAFAVLQHLVEHAGTLVAREDLIRKVWGHVHVTDSSLSQCLRDVRHALDDHDQRLIFTVPGRGYRFEPPGEPPAANQVSHRDKPRPWKVPGLALALMVVGALLVYVVVGTSNITEVTHSTGNSVADPRSIAVLPFTNLSPDEEMAYFADGLTEDLLNLLAGIEGVRVAARTSSFYFKGKLNEIPLAEIARQLNVAYVLEGSVRKDGNEVRVTAQLIKTSDGFHVWSDSWDRTLEGIFSVQDEIAANVAAVLESTLIEAIPRARVVNTESYELGLQGRYLINRRSEGDLERALEVLTRAVELDPDNVTAWTALAPLYLWLFDPPRVGDSLAASERAIALDPNDPEAWSRRAVALLSSGDREAAEVAWSRAISLGENNALIQAQLAGEMAMKGDIEGAIDIQKRAIALDPLIALNISNLGHYLLFQGKFADARVQAEKLLNLLPDSLRSWELLTMIQLLTNEPAGARDSVNQMASRDIDFTESRRPRDWWEAMVEFSLGNLDSSEAALERFMNRGAADLPLSTACLFAWQGDSDSAFLWLNRTLDQYPELTVMWSHEPWLNSLRSDPRWEELMQRWTGEEYFEPL